MLNSFITDKKPQFDTYMYSTITDLDIPAILRDAMMYSLKIGGKRMRPLFLFAVLEGAKVPIEKGFSVASALEIIHTYSLIHDDLPAMDNDDLRRGFPTNHIKFGDALAILAGDALLTYAFDLIATDESIGEKTRLALISELSRAAGATGMIAGQVLDIKAENNIITLDELVEIHRKKTGCLIEYAIFSGAKIAELSDKETHALVKYATHLGLAFQIKDDILDVESDTATLGKPVGSDEQNQKCTYVSLTSLEKAKQMLAREIDEALAALKELTIDTVLLHELAMYVSIRDV